MNKKEMRAHGKWIASLTALGRSLRENADGIERIKTRFWQVRRRAFIRGRADALREVAALLDGTAAGFGAVKMDKVCTLEE